VGADREAIAGLDRATGAGLPVFVHRVKDHADRAAWDTALTASVAGYRPDLVVTAGFMKILGPEFVAAFAGRIVNTHPALLPAFPGAHGVADALAYGVKVTGCTVHLVDGGVDTGPIIAQGVVAVEETDHADGGAALHERIKTVERQLLVDVVGRLAREGHRIEDRKVWIPA
jgi:phosphoribosylglycinamide formyltransferase 1